MVGDGELQPHLGPRHALSQASPSGALTGEAQGLSRLPKGSAPDSEPRPRRVLTARPCASRCPSPSLAP